MDFDGQLAISTKHKVEFIINICWSIYISIKYQIAFISPWNSAI